LATRAVAGRGQNRRADCLEFHLTALAHREEMFVLFLVHGAFPILGSHSLEDLLSVVKNVRNGSFTTEARKSQTPMHVRHNDVMQTRSFRGSGEPARVNASSNACERLGPGPRRALGPAAIRAASTGRTHDRTRPMLHQRKKLLSIRRRPHMTRSGHRPRRKPPSIQNNSGPPQGLGLRSPAG
jgi:hypothetical protein